MALDDGDFAGQLREWLKTLRKKNASVLFATQSLSDIAKPLQVQFFDPSSCYPASSRDALLSGSAFMKEVPMFCDRLHFVQ